MFDERRHRSDQEAVERMVARYRQIGELQAEFYADVAEILRRLDEADPEFGLECADAEIGAALALSRTAANKLITIAFDLETYPELAGGLREGFLDLTKVRVILYGVSGMSIDEARPIVREAVEQAAGKTGGQLRSLVRKLRICVDPDAEAKRYRAGVEERRLSLTSNDDGTANLLGLNLPAERANQIFGLIDQQANRTPADGRTLDQLRADLFVDALTGSNSSRPVGVGTVDIRVDLTTLIGLDENPAEIPGWGPVIADIARQISEERTRWEFQVFDGPELVSTGVTRRRPDARTRRRIRARLPNCVFPGCSRPARRSDLDHRRQWSEGGLTTEKNMEPLCRHHHLSKDSAGGLLEMIDQWTFEWVSPLGMKYVYEVEPP